MKISTAKYTIQALCQNCGAIAEMSVPKGVAVYDVECPTCVCVGVMNSVSAMMTMKSMFGMIEYEDGGEEDE